MFVCCNRLSQLVILTHLKNKLMVRARLLREGACVSLLSTN